jgi:hypothetical protein
MMSRVSVSFETSSKRLINTSIWPSAAFNSLVVVVSCSSK